MQAVAIFTRTREEHGHLVFDLVGWRSFVSLMEREGIIGKCHRTECFFGGRMRQSMPSSVHLEKCRRLQRAQLLNSTEKAAAARL